MSDKRGYAVWYDPIQDHGHRSPKVAKMVDFI